MLLLPPDPHHDLGTLLQLFIMLGNDRANRFWAARLPAAEALYPDASAEQRRDFISHKYREGRYRLPHPHYTTQEDVLQVGAGNLGMQAGYWGAGNHPRDDNTSCLAVSACTLVPGSSWGSGGRLYPTLPAFKHPQPTARGLCVPGHGPYRHLSHPRHCALQ